MGLMELYGYAQSFVAVHIIIFRVWYLEGLDSVLMPCRLVCGMQAL